MKLHSEGLLRSVYIHEGEKEAIDIAILKEVQETYNLPGINLTEVRTCLDAGANIGAFTRYLSIINPNCKIIAVEPIEDNYDLLTLNTIGIENVKRLLGFMCEVDCREDLIVVYSKGNSGGHRILPASSGKLYNGPDDIIDFVGKAYSLSDCISLLDGTLDLLKLDCEGCEYGIIQNANLSNVNKIVGEYHDGIDTFSSRCIMKLEKQGFDVTFYDSWHPHGKAAGIGLFTAIRR